MRNNKIFYGLALMFLAGTVFFLGYQISKKSNNRFGKKHRSQLQNDSISITGIKQLISDCSCDIEIIPSENERVEFIFNKKEHKNLSKINDSTLNIDFENDDFKFFSWGDESAIQIKVYTHSISKINQNGVGDVLIENEYQSENLEVKNDGVGSMNLNINTTNLLVENNGVGSIDLKGKSIQLKLSNEGTGSIDASLLLAKHGKVTNDGVGSVDVNASDSLDLRNDGVGNISYSGTAIVYNQKSEGVGSIDKK